MGAGAAPVATILRSRSLNVSRRAVELHAAADDERVRQDVVASRWTPMRSRSTSDSPSGRRAVGQEPSPVVAAMVMRTSRGLDVCGPRL